MQRKAVFFPLVLFLLFLGGMGTWGTGSPSPAEKDENAVKTAGKALGSKSVLGERYPWYSSESDGTRFIPFEEIKQPSNWGSDFSLAAVIFKWFMFFLMFIAFLLLLYLLVWLAYLYIPGLRKFTEAGKAEDERKRRIETLPIEAQEEIGDLLGAAIRAYERGDYKRAVVLYYSHLLVLLDQYEMIRLHRGKTNHEYALELSRYPSRLPHYQDTMFVFEKTYFGDYPLDLAEFEPIWSQRKSYINLVKTGEVVSG